MPQNKSMPDEHQIEKILSTIQPMPGEGFYSKMKTTPWQVKRTGKTTTMKYKYAFLTLAMLLALTATVVFVPPVRAQVEEWFFVKFQSPNNSNLSFGFVSNEPMKYQLMQPGYLPEIFKDINSASFGDVSELLYKVDDTFLIITQQPAADNDALPDGEAVTINGLPAVLNTNLSGTYQNQPPSSDANSSGGIYLSSGGDMTPEASLEITSSSQDLQIYTGTLPDGAEVPLEQSQADGDVIIDNIGSESMSLQSQPNVGVTVENLAPIAPESFEYFNASKLTFIMGRTKIELLTNLPMDELLKIAEQLIPAN